MRVVFPCDEVFPTDAEWCFVFSELCDVSLSVAFPALVIQVIVVVVAKFANKVKYC